MNHEGVCKTAPATPGLLIISFNNYYPKIFRPVVWSIFSIFCWTILILSSVDNILTDSQIQLNNI